MNILQYFDAGVPRISIPEKNLLFSYVSLWLPAYDITLSYMVFVILDFQYAKPSSYGSKSRSTSGKARDYMATSSAMSMLTSSWDKVWCSGHAYN